jgi:hypothetical protein
LERESRLASLELRRRAKRFAEDGMMRLDMVYNKGRSN